MTPFLALSLKDLLLSIMGHFLKKEVLEKADTFKKLSAIDPADKKKQKTQSMLTLALLLNSFLGFVFKRFVTVYHKSFFKKRFRKS